MTEPKINFLTEHTQTGIANEHSNIVWKEFSASRPAEGGMLPAAAL